MSADNGKLPAFHVTESEGLWGKIETHRGLTKREYFAALAMAAMVGQRDHEPDGAPEHIAAISARCADALIVELDKPAGL